MVCPSNLLEEDFSNLILYQKQQSANNNKEEDFWEPVVKKIEDTKVIFINCSIAFFSLNFCIFKELSLYILSIIWLIKFTLFDDLQPHPFFFL